MQYTSTERQAKHDKLDRIYDRLLEMQDRWEDHNTESLIKELDLQFEILDIEEAQAQIDKCRADRIITADAHETACRAIRFQKQALIDQLSAMVKDRQSEASLKIG